MARTIAELPKGSRITDYISLGVVAKSLPGSHREVGIGGYRTEQSASTELPAHVVVYYVIALALYMQSSYREVLRGLLEGIQWLLNPAARIKVTGKSGISQARTRLGVEPVKQLHYQIVCPIATEVTKGAWYRGWRVVSLDGSTLEVADEDANDAAFGRPVAQRGKSAFPQIRFVSLVKRHPRAVWFPDGRLWDERNDLGQGRASLAEPRYAVPGGPVFL